MTLFSIWTKKMKSLKDRYVGFFEDLISKALSGNAQTVHFCDDVVLELYLDGEELHWRRINGGDQGSSGRDSQD